MQMTQLSIFTRVCSRVSWRSFHTRSSSVLSKFSLEDNQYSTKKINIIKPVFLHATNFPERLAIVDKNGSYTYQELLQSSSRLTDEILDTLEEQHTLNHKRICYITGNDVSNVIAQWAAWMSGGVAVPLCKTHPLIELEYFVRDSCASLIIGSEDYREVVQTLASKINVKCIVLDKSYTDNTAQVTEESLRKLEAARLVRENRWHQMLEVNKFKTQPAIIVYTSGTTGKPKGVVHTFGSLQSNINDMVQAWQWTKADSILHVLPLHHTHGIVNTMLVPLSVGAVCNMVPKFDPREVWQRLLQPGSLMSPRINVFMAVPTIYSMLTDDYEKRLSRGRGTRTTKEYIKSVCVSKIRLMVSGSAGLPLPVLEKWEAITGHRLLERYGMTEVGMVLTNPLRGLRVAGAVGKPFPSSEVRITSPNVYSDKGYDVLVEANSRITQITPGYNGELGELYIRGPNMFKEYWNKPEATSETFTKDGWFMTGDTAVLEEGVFRIVGRTSVDIIKCGGFKISAVDVEAVLLLHEDIVDVAVLGLPDMTWGEKVTAVVVLKPNKELSLTSLYQWAKDKLPSYKIPTVIKVLDEMPRNALGKVNKKAMKTELFPEYLK